MNTSRPNDVCYADVCAAQNRIDHWVTKTPAIVCDDMCEELGTHDIDIVLKCENFQRTGSFKFRGASNAIELLDADARSRGVITYSSGNHAQAIARAAKQRNIPATVVMPRDAPAVKVAGAKAWGAMIVTYERQAESREDLCAAIASEHGLTIIPPFDHPHVIAGQGTVAAELIEQAGPFDAIFVPCGGGGLLAGTGIATRHLCPECNVYGVEPAMADDAARSFASKTLCSTDNPQTIADGARTHALGGHTFPLILRHVDGFFTVSEQAIARAMKLLYERCKIVVEPTGALAMAGVLEHRNVFAGKRVGVIVSGGNVDLGQLPSYFSLA